MFSKDELQLTGLAQSLVIHIGKLCLKVTINNLISFRTGQLKAEHLAAKPGLPTLAKLLFKADDKIDDQINT